MSGIIKQRTLKAQKELVKNSLSVVESFPCPYVRNNKAILDININKGLIVSMNLTNMPRGEKEEGHV